MHEVPDLPKSFHSVNSNPRVDKNIHNCSSNSCVFCVKTPLNLKVQICKICHCGCGERRCVADTYARTQDAITLDDSEMSSLAHVILVDALKDLVHSLVNLSPDLLPRLLCSQQCRRPASERGSWPGSIIG
jgi:hypothetical protein